MSKRVVRAAALGFVVLLIGVGAIAVSGADARNFRASPLSGYDENPDISTGARGSFTARLLNNGTTLRYTLRFEGLEGGAITQSHIHFGKRAVNGGVSIFLCGTPGSSGPAGTPTCPQSGTVTRDVTAAEVVGPSVQGIEPREFDEIIAAMRAGHAYVNVHSTRWPTGEIRAQIKTVR